MSRMIRVESLLKQEISRIIQQDFRSNLGLISITGLKIAKDLSSATVFYSHLGSDDERKRSFEKLKKSASFVKGKLGQHIRLKRIPNLTFRLDNSIERGFNTIAKLNDIND
ncbi:MAG: 30S ribosome-binding factor RbfA [Candidatus Marinamargulisbacteria bacterium]|jgi:ribosome-binding factor A